MAKSFSSSPQPSVIQQLIQLLNQGHLAMAEQKAVALIAQHPREFILHHVLSLALDQQQKYAEAATSYQTAIQLQPNMPDLHFNLAIAHTQLNQLQEAEHAYRKAIQLQPGFFEAHGNLGTILQRQGNLDGAIQCYQTGLRINPQDARGHFNLGTVLRDKGLLHEAVKHYQQAIQLFPNYTDAYNNLGETYRDLGNMSEAIQQYQRALSLNAQHASANYNMAEFLYLAKRFTEAIPYFEQSQLDDWQERILYCLYKAEQFDAFKQKRDALIQQAPHTSPFLATLSTHYSINFNEADPYNFCKDGLQHVYHRAIPALAPNSALLNALLHDIHHADIAERKQARLTNGKQSAGNLFKRPEASFRQLAELIQQEFVAYREHFAGADCTLITAFPQTLEFTSSWYVSMRQGGHLNAHIHEIGWISGAVYLAMPETEDEKEGAFEYGTHGDDYPQQHTNFPTAFIKPNVGDIVLFPSSLFHRTIPFSAQQARICIAFDLKPQNQFMHARSNY
ncbi:tetratricopeptide repeat protein [Methylotenera sp. 1P/1]|uniref:tetratricopeptide repeat protein n=1 Tax=Methylotenera sp. 1P/1 TaxID=1131551 RepID=UPI000382008A|nr:tetratricopeptide repeat protein [Methylotenera sp. 1P/1]